MESQDRKNCTVTVVVDVNNHKTYTFDGDVVLVHIVCIQLKVQQLVKGVFLSVKHCVVGGFQYRR